MEVHGIILPEFDRNMKHTVHHCWTALVKIDAKGEDYVQNLLTVVRTAPL